MSFAEVRWRSAATMRDAADRFRFPLGIYPGEKDATQEGERNIPPSWRVCDLSPGAWRAGDATSKEKEWLSALLQKADPIAANRLDFFDLKDRFLGDPVDWNRDHDAGIPAPMGFSPAIDYRDYRVTGDAKVVWEPNRHHQLVVLGRAYRASGDTRYAGSAVTMLESWMTQCPFGRGMNWRSPLELAIRLINWVWAYDLILESGTMTGAFRSRFLHAAYLHLWEITRKLSKGSSANNHSIGEAAGVFIASCYFPFMKNAAEWREESKGILEAEIIAQTYPDGGGREQAFGYHLFVLQFFLTAGLVGRKSGTDFTEGYWRRIEKMLEFAGCMAEGGGTPPMFGDCDDGYVLDLGEPRGDLPGLLSTGAALFGRPDFKVWSGSFSEMAEWLLGKNGREKFEALETGSVGDRLESHSYPESGSYLLQYGSRGVENRISVSFDCGELGFKSIAAHGHADVLSVTLRVFGQDILVDPGTYDYFKFPEERNYFRSTRAHNTVEVDGLDQSEMLGPFLWGKRANAKVLRWEPSGNVGTVEGEHDGYSRLDDPVVHRRKVELNSDERILIITDSIRSRKLHVVKIRYQFGEKCDVRKEAVNRYVATHPSGSISMEMNDLLVTSLSRGVESPMEGWVSRGYHQKTPIYTLIGECEAVGDVSLVTTLRILPTPDENA